MRLPARFQTRGLFALGAFVLGSAFSTAILYPFSGMTFSFEFLFPGMFAALSAGFSWPTKTERTVSRMAWAGLLTVAVALFLFSVAFTLPISIYGGQESAEALTFEHLMRSAGIIPVVFIAASILTLGIPYFLGAWTAMLFVED